METTDWMVAIFMSVGGIVCSAIFSGFENGVVSIRQPRLHYYIDHGNSGAKYIQYFLKRPTTMLATILLGNNIANILLAVYVEKMSQQITQNTLGLTLISFCLTIVLLIAGEITPKVWFRQHPIQRCSKAAIPIYAFYWLAYLPILMLTYFVNGLNKLLAGKASSEKLHRNEEFRMMFKESLDDGELTQSTTLMMQHLLDYNSLTVRDLMVDKAYTVVLEGNLSLDEAVKIAKEKQMKRFPVVLKSDPNNWIGIFSVYDVIFKIPEDQWKDKNVLMLTRDLVTLGADENISEVLSQTARSKLRLMVVLDSDGKGVGVISPSDVMKPMFGQLA